MRSQFGIKLREKYEELDINFETIGRGTSFLKPIIGCTTQEIDRAKEIQHTKHFPDIFVMYLREMGKSTSEYKIMTQSGFRKSTVKKRLNNAMKRNGDLTLVDNAVVIMEYNTDLHYPGTWWWYFVASEDDNDPMIYEFWDADSCREEETLEEEVELHGTMEKAIHHELVRLSKHLTQFIAMYENDNAQAEFLEKYT